NERWARMPELSHTRLQPLDPNRFYLGNSTPHDSLWTMGKLMEQQDQYAGFMKDAMAANIFEDFGVRSQLAGTDFVVLVNKIGLLDDIEGNNRHDVGAIYNEKTGKTYAYSFMTTAPYDAADPTATQRAEQSLREMGRATLRFAGSNKAYGSPESGTWSKRIEGRVLY
ncbi:MAG TPA: serine hydrolase, partial [Candidatus Saccharimonadales bacterium]|nr:serine hydrolase [Candidatus Saccharimonadales bacterium]